MSNEPSADPAGQMKSESVPAQNRQDPQAFTYENDSPSGTAAAKNQAESGQVQDRQAPQNRQADQSRKDAQNTKDAQDQVNLDQALEVVMDAGLLFLRAGAEVYRAENTINRLGKSIPGVDDCVAYVTVTGMMCTMIAHGQTVTRIARVQGTSHNISVINAINQLSRNAERYHFSADQIRAILSRIKKIKSYSKGQRALFGALGALGFAIFFNGTWFEILAVFLIGLVIQMICSLLEKYELNLVFVNGLAAFGAAYVSEWIHSFYPLAKVDVLIISSIMLLVPGLTMTNAIRDTVMGEYLSGVVRGAEALIIAVSIALGVGLALTMF